MSEPCPLCAVRADIGCKHREAEGEPPPKMVDKVDPRRSVISGGGNYRIVTNRDGAGRAFHQRKKD